VAYQTVFRTRFWSRSQLCIWEWPPPCRPKSGWLPERTTTAHHAGGGVACISWESLWPWLLLCLWWVVLLAVLIAMWLLLADIGFPQSWLIATTLQDLRLTEFRVGSAVCKY